jgi:hypothetical protein
MTRSVGLWSASAASTLRVCLHACQVFSGRLSGHQPCDRVQRPGCNFYTGLPRSGPIPRVCQRRFDILIMVSEQDQEMPSVVQLGAFPFPRRVTFTSSLDERGRETRSPGPQTPQRSPQHPERFQAALTTVLRASPTRRPRGSCGPRCEHLAVRTRPPLPGDAGKIPVRKP